MSSPQLRRRYIESNREKLHRIASLGHQNVGRGVVVILTDSTNGRSPSPWKGTTYPYFVEDCLFRRLVHDIWLRKHPGQRNRILHELTGLISGYDPATSMVIAFLSTDGTIEARQMEISPSDSHSAAA